MESQMRMILSETENLYENDPFAFTLWLDEAKNMATKDGDISRALIESNNEKKAVEISMSKIGDSSNKTNNRICICSPTTHVGSFKCKYHRSMASSNPSKIAKQQLETDNDDNNKSFNGVRSVRTGTANSHHRLSRFGRAACDDMSLKVQ